MVRGICAPNSHLGTLWSSHHSITADHHTEKKEKKRALEGLISTIKCSSREVTNPVTRTLGSWFSMCLREKNRLLMNSTDSPISNNSVTGLLADLFIHLFTHLFINQIFI